MVKAFALAVAVISFATGSAVAREPVAGPGLVFQLEAPIEIGDVRAPGAAGAFSAVVDVPGKSGCHLTGRAAITGMTSEGAAVQFDLVPGASLKCNGESAQPVKASLAAASGAPWIPPQINLCTLWTGTDASKHPECLKRTVAAYLFSTGVVRLENI
jgi:hypothetical protein